MTSNKLHRLYNIALKTLKRASSESNEDLKNLGMALTQITTALTILCPDDRPTKVRKLLEKIIMLQSIVSIIQIVTDIIRIKSNTIDKAPVLTIEKQKLFDFGFLVEDTYAQDSLSSVGAQAELSLRSFINPEYLIRFLLNKNPDIEVYEASCKEKPYKNIRDSVLSHREKINITEYLLIIRDGVKINAKSGQYLFYIKPLQNRITVMADSYSDRYLEFLSSLQSEFMREFQGNLLRMFIDETYGRFVCMNVEELTHTDLSEPDKVAELKALITKALDTNQKLAILLYGRPGVGKSTTLQEAIINTNTLNISIDDQLSFNEINMLLKGSDCKKIILMEDIFERYEVAPIERNDEVVVYATRDHNAGRGDKSQMLKLLDSDLYDIAVITSNTTRLPESLCRSGRVDLKIKFELPDEDKRVKIIDNLVRYYENNIASGGSIPSREVIKLAKMTAGLTHADLAAIFKLAMLSDISPIDYLPKFLQAKKEFDEFGMTDNEMEFEYD